MTDVTGFGLLGHLLEMCRGASLGAEIEFEALPLLTKHGAWRNVELARVAPNRWSYGHEVDLPPAAPEWWRGVLCDPQTSGGLLIACSSDYVPQVLELLERRNFIHAEVLGTFVSALPRIRVY